MRNRRDGESSEAPKQLMCTRRSAPAALAASAIRRAAVTCTSSKLNRGVSNSAPIRLMTTFDWDTALAIKPSSRTSKSANATICAHPISPC